MEEHINPRLHFLWDSPLDAAPHSRELQIVGSWANVMVLLLQQINIYLTVKLGFLLHGGSFFFLAEPKFKLLSTLEIAYLEMYG